MLLCDGRLLRCRAEPRCQATTQKGLAHWLLCRGEARPSLRKYLSEGLQLVCIFLVDRREAREQIRKVSTYEKT